MFRGPLLVGRTVIISRRWNAWPTTARIEFAVTGSTTRRYARIRPLRRLWGLIVGSEETHDKPERYKRLVEVVIL